MAARRRCDLAATPVGRTALTGGDPAAAVRLLDECLALWRGPALADLGDLEFAEAVRTLLEGKRLGAVELRMDALLDSGRHGEMIAELETLTANYALRERFWSQRLPALYRCGRQADALSAYRELRTILAEQLGIEPGPELRELEARILRQDARFDYRPARQTDGDDKARPETRYVESGGVHIAYQVLGRGERDIVCVPGALSHLDLLWEDPETAGFFHRLATLGRLIPFDKRDTGLSDRAPADSPLEERMDDVRAVMHAAGSGEAVLFGYLEGAPMSILFTATYPELVSSLILRAATARYRRAPDYPCGRGSDEMFDSLEKIAAHRWGQGATIDWFLPSRASSPPARQMFARFERMADSPSAFLRIVRMVREIDLRAVLPAIHVPTLVIQRLDDIMTPPCHGRYLASQIAGARYFEQPRDKTGSAMLEAVRVRPALRPGLAVWTPAGVPRSDAVRRRSCLRCCLGGMSSRRPVTGSPASMTDAGDCPTEQASAAPGVRQRRRGGGGTSPCRRPPTRSS